MILIPKNVYFTVSWTWTFYNLCDDILFLATASFVHPLAAFAYNSNWNVQAPVSDREYRATLPETASMIDLASTMIAEGRSSELMPKEADPSAPITAYRYACNILQPC